MKVLLIQPPIEDFFFTPQRAYPLAVLSLASTLAKKGRSLNVGILDCFEGSRKQTLSIPDGLAYLKRYYQPNISPFCLFAHYYHFGLPFDHIERRIAEFAPDIVGISASFTPYYESSLRVALSVKKINARIPVVIGGRAASVQPEVFLKHDAVDFVLRGEAEHTLLSLCNDLQQNKTPQGPGLCHKYGKDLHIASDTAVIDDLDGLAMLDRRLINYPSYRYYDDISTSLLASRGCRMSCAFCAINEPFRVRSAKNILQEIQQCFDIGNTHFNFEDDNILLHPQLPQIIDGIIDIGKGKARLSFMNGLMTKGLTGRMLSRLIRAGLTHADLSLVSGNPRLRKALNRFDEIRSIKRVSRTLERHRVPATVHFIIGFPKQTMRDALTDIQRLAAEPVLLGPSIFYPVIGSRLFNRHGRWSRYDPRIFRSSAACVDTDMKRDEILTLVYFARLINFIKRCCGDPSLRRQIQSFCQPRKAVTRSPDDEHLWHSFDRNAWGIYLLREMLVSHSISRVTRTACHDRIQYRFAPEAFISRRMVRLLLNTLTIRDLNGRSISIVSGKRPKKF